MLNHFIMSRKRKSPPRKEPSSKRRRISRGRPRLQPENLIATIPNPGITISASGKLFNEHGINLDPALASSISRVRNANTERVLDLYKNDFFYRLFAHPDQLQFIGYHLLDERDHPGKYPDIERLVIEPKVTERVNCLQHRLFLDCERILKKTMEFPDGYPRAVPKSETDGIARCIINKMRLSDDSYEFRYIILRLYHANASFRSHINKMIPNRNAEVIRRLLSRFLISNKSSGFEGAMLFEDNKFSKTVQLVQRLFAMYMSNFGLLRIQDRNSEPIREEFFL